MFALSLENKQILQYGILFFIMQSIPVRIWRYNLPKYARAITKSSLDTVLATGFGANAFVNQITRVAVFIQINTFQFINLMINLIKSEHKLKHRNNDLIKPISCFKYKTLEELK